MGAMAVRFEPTSWLSSAANSASESLQATKTSCCSRSFWNPQSRGLPRYSILLKLTSGPLEGNDRATKIVCWWTPSCRFVFLVHAAVDLRELRVLRGKTVFVPFVAIS